ncbi:MAG: hypothetical protein LBQ83_02090 [Candidatus Margulisbacteria bacterium]|nr:hypothetical protein [Candidatus Margulisiibacteriota bacterium]
MQSKQLSVSWSGYRKFPAPPGLAQQLLAVQRENNALDSLHRYKPRLADRYRQNLEKVADNLAEAALPWVLPGS